MSNLSNLKEIQVEGRKVAPTFNLALWEYFYDLEFKRYWSLVEKKAWRLKKLKETDLFSLPEKEAKKKNWQIKYIEDELSDMAGIKDYAENLKAAYLNTSVWLLNHFERKESNHLEKIESIKRDYQRVMTAYESSSNGERIWLQMATACIEEANSKGLNLDCFKNADLWK